MDHDLFSDDLPTTNLAGTSKAADVPARRGLRVGAVVAGAFALMACWGVVAMAVNADTASDLSPDSTGTASLYEPDSSESPYSSSSSGSSSQLPLGPIGEASCRAAVSDAKSYVPDAIRDAQSGVDDLIAEHPELAAYAADARRMLAQSAPDVYRSLDDAGDQLGC
jgi:hypothetical protein